MPKHIRAAGLLVAAGLGLSACAQPYYSSYDPGSRTLAGAAAGGLGGAALGGILGGGRGAAIGAGLGAATGAIAGHATTPQQPAYGQTGGYHSQAPGPYGQAPVYYQQPQPAPYYYR